MSAPWKPELDAILGARHGGAAEAVISRLRELDRRHPNVGEIHVQLAWSLASAGRHPEALEHYERALALGLAPHEHAGALVGLGCALLELGQPARACETFRSGRSLFPDQREFDAFLAVALRAAGHSDEAAQILLDVLIETSEDRGIAAYQRSLRHLSAAQRRTP